jgi:cytochrome c oxidase assembly factor CtaG
MTLGLAGIALAGIAAVYLCTPGRLRSFRPAVFLGGVCVIWIAIASPLAALDHQLLTIHMVQHLLLMTVASPLILWGLPAPWPATNLRHLACCWMAGTATVIGWHIPAAFQLALGSSWWHGVEQASFLLAGLLFWWPVRSSTGNEWSGNEWSVPLYLFLATLPCDILSAFLVFCGRVVYPSYLAAPRLFDLSALQDQEIAGALMWVSVTLIYLIPAVIITVQILSPVARSAAKAVQS